MKTSLRGISMYLVKRIGLGRDFRFLLRQVNSLGGVIEIKKATHLMVAY
jgi:hypothetical protein